MTTATAATAASGSGTASAGHGAAVAAPPEPSVGEEGRDRSALLVGLTAYVAVLGLVVVLALRQSEGHLIYVLDDPAIHQSMASHLVEDGTWGVEPGRFESASSSPLWTTVLAGFIALAPVGDDAGPLVLNAVAALVVVAILLQNQAVLRPARGRHADTLAVVAVVTVVLFLPGLTLVGMEHVLHMALVLGAVVLVHRQGEGELVHWPRWLPYLLLVLATLTRLETAFVAAGIAVAALARSIDGWGPDGPAAPWRRQSRQAALVGLAASVPLTAVVVWTRLMGQGLLPNSVAAKSQPEPTAPPLYRAAIERFTADPLVAVVTVVLAMALVLAWRQPRRFVFPAVATVVAVALHMALARIGWYERYQAYLVVLAVYAALQLIPEALALVRARRPRASLAAIVVLALLPFCGTKLFLTVDSGLAVSDTYRQRYQAGRFLAEYYDGEAVATGELGYVSLLHDGPITDVLGLGDHEVLRERLATGRPDAAYWERLMAERGIEVVAVYPSTIGDETPEGWLLAGWWSLPRRTVTAFQPEFQFWATTPEALVELQDHLRRFTPELPGGIEVEINEEAAVEAAQLGNPEPPTP